MHGGVHWRNEDEDVLLISLNARVQFPCMFGQIEFAVRTLLNGT